MHWGEISDPLGIPQPRPIALRKEGLDPQHAGG
jgi:hypothetical protein